MNDSASMRSVCKQIEGATCMSGFADTGGVCYVQMAGMLSHSPHGQPAAHSCERKDTGYLALT